MSIPACVQGALMADKFDHFFDVYDRIVPAWFFDVFVAVGLAGIGFWVVSLVF